MEILKLSTEADVIKALATKIQECAKKAIEDSGVFRVGVSGN